MKLKTLKYSLTYENASIRWIKHDGTEIVRMIYSAVRDHNWGTIEPEIVSEKIDQTEAGFRIDARVRYKQGNLHFEAEHIISGTEARLVFEMKGVAKSTFKTNRVGFCVLHPIKECAGKSCRVFHPDGTWENAVFPEFISPVQPMKNISEMEWEPTGNISARLSFSGDVFEMEDQRNWTDASYKTYCRPLVLPSPFEIKKGEKVVQKIVLEIKAKPQNEFFKSNFTYSIHSDKILAIPEIGTGATSRSEPLEQKEAEWLRKLPLQHVRAEINLFKQSWKTELKTAIAEATLLGLQLFLVLCFSEKCEDEIKEIKQNFQNRKIKVKYIMVVGKNHVPDDLIFDSVYDALHSIFPEARIGTGVNAYFAELNRNRPQSQNAGFISFAICPQLHAFDNSSLAENLEAQKYAVESARQLFPGKPIFVSPVTLKQRFNVVATSPEPEALPGELPSQVDTRQNTVFAALWLLASLKYLAQAGVSLVTYFETVGWRGFIQGNYEPPVPAYFNSKKEDLFPVYHLLKKLTGFSDIIYSISSHPSLFDGLVVQSETETRLFLFSFSNEDIEIQIKQCNTEKKRSVLLKAFDLLEISC